LRPLAEFAAGHTRPRGPQRLRIRDAWGVLHAASCLLRVTLSLRHESFLRLLQRFRLTDPLPPASPREVADAVRWVRWAHRLVPLQRNCLLDSLAAAVLLRRAGAGSSLAIGVCRDGSAVRAHAWLEGEASGGHGFEILWRSSATCP